VIRKQLELFAISAAEDLAYLSLADACQITSGLEARIVGGHMVQLLTQAFPTTYSTARQTVDADAAVDSQLAASGQLHALFEAAGYQASSGNSYQLDGKSIDLVVPSGDGRFKSELLGGRAFDASPGLDIALAASPIELEVAVTLTDGSKLAVAVRVPTVEIAVVLKALVYRVRLAERDLEDLQNLLWIARSYPAEEIGGWRLDTPCRGARGDAQRSLNLILEKLSRSDSQLNPVINSQALAGLITEKIARSAL
jgi:hypothetical protein